MENYANIVFSDPLPLNNTGEVQYMDIIEILIDNIPCELEYGIRKGYWWLHIQDRNIRQADDGCLMNHSYLEKCEMEDNYFFEDFDKEAVITPDVIDKFIKHILDLFESLKFSKIEGRFLSKKFCRKQIARKIVFGKYLEEENKDDKCSVCFDFTKTKTPCSHILCIPCWIKIKNKCCPICRGDISFFENAEETEN